ncbi:SAM-dependent methyltransferase [Roseovarius sp. MBR-51]
MQLDIDIEAEAAEDRIAALDLSCFDRNDLVNLILQRSEVMFDRPKSGRVIKAWQQGNDAPIQAVVDDMGDTIARRAAGVIHAEYKAIKGLLQELNPKHIADIGCGYGFFDLFAAQDLTCTVLLIDIESNTHRHFGFNPEGAAYSSLSRARHLLTANGIAPEAIETLNPNETTPEPASAVDLAVSFLSCGFHYPVDLYLPFVDKVLRSGGVAIFDLRKNTAEEQARKLGVYGALSDMDSPPKSRRVLLRKSQP